MTGGRPTRSKSIDYTNTDCLFTSCNTPNIENISYNNIERNKIKVTNRTQSAIGAYLLLVLRYLY